MKVIHFNEIDSTNKYLKERYTSLDNFTFVSSNYQSEGKGRGDHTWKAIKGENLLFSILLKEKDIISKYEYLPIVTPYLISKYLEDKYHLITSIKWPNDIYVNDKKICGILLEGQVEQYIVIGIGLNVNQVEFIGEYKKTPTSIKLELNKDINIDELKDDLFTYIYSNLIKSLLNLDEVYQYVTKRNYLLNKRVSFLFNGVKEKGIVTSIDKKFNLIVNVMGNSISLNSGEIDVLPDK